jgi:oligopeptide transport system ATP-binding protein
VRGIDFCIHQGETIGIVGESGCGKSTAAKALVQLNPAHSTEVNGEIIYGKENLLTFSEKQMRAIRGKEIGMIFQDPMTSLNPTMKVGRQIMEGYLRHYPNTSSKEAREIALDMLNKVGIPSPDERFYFYPYMLSGGMRQRVMIALALACGPKVLIADEPTTALDATIQAQVLDLLKAIQRETMTSILLITHDMGVVAKMCDKVLVMYAGKIVESASADEIFSNPQHPYTQRLIAASDRLNHSKDRPLLTIEGVPPDLSYPLNHCGFCTRCPDAMKICALHSPPLVETHPGHSSACFKHAN